MRKRNSGYGSNQRDPDRSNSRPATKSDSRKEYTDPVVFRVRRDTQCGKCNEELGKGRLVKLEGEGNKRIALCRPCAGLADHYFVLSGDAKFTRLLSKYLKQKHVVVRWSTTRKRYERQGIRRAGSS